MPENKSPYQIRQELLDMSKNYFENMYNMQLMAIKRQFDFAEEVMRKNEEVGKEMLDKTTDNLEKYFKEYPGVDQILSVARQFQDFVDNKDKK